MSIENSFYCPIPIDAQADRILLAHGEGGSLMRRLITERIVSKLASAATARTLDDAVVLPPLNGLPVMTTDAFVVTPLFFPGGDIGSLCVFGTVNDLAVRGAEPLWLTLSLILEEGLPIAVLDRVLDSVAAAARQCSVSIVAGDTKVVPRGAADGIFITTTGLGQLIEPAPRGAAYLSPSDLILVSGPIGRHGIAVLAARDQLGFDPAPTSDCAPVLPATKSLRAAGICPIAMRDATRGGVTGVLHEWANDCGHSILVDESQLPLTADVRGVCELLGLDPLHIANEGTMLIAVPAAQGDTALAALQASANGQRAAIIGRVQPRGVAPVVVRRLSNREQPLIEPAGSPLPRIC